MPALASAGDAPGEPSIAFLALRTIASLALVVGLLFALRHLLKRVPAAALRRSRGGEHLALRGRLDLGARREVRLVEVRDRLLVLGISGESMTLLADFEAVPAAAAETGEAAASRAPEGESPLPAFAAFLQRLTTSS